MIRFLFTQWGTALTIPSAPLAGGAPAQVARQTPPPVHFWPCLQSSALLPLCLVQASAHAGVQHNLCMSV